MGEIEERARYWFQGFKTMSAVCKEKKSESYYDEWQAINQEFTIHHFLSNSSMVWEQIETLKFLPKIYYNG